MTAPAGTRYATHDQTQRDARAVAALDYTGRVEIALLQHIEAMLLSPYVNSDWLLIYADGLREVATPWRGLDKGRALIDLADKLATLAPTRATPIPQSKKEDRT